MTYMNVAKADLKKAKVLTADELKWLEALRIPFTGAGHLWAEKFRLDALVSDAVESGKVKPIYREVKIQRGPHVISDDLGLQGILNPANGKKYDSKSAYYKAVKEAGCVVLGNDAPTKAKGPEARICEKDLKQDIKQAIEQLGG